MINLTTISFIIMLVCNITLFILLKKVKSEYYSVSSSLSGYHSLLKEGRLFQKGWKTWGFNADTKIFDNEIFNKINNEVLTQTHDRCKRYPEKPNIPICVYLAEDDLILMLHEIRRLEVENKFLKNFQESYNEIYNEVKKDYSQSTLNNERSDENEEA